jgi:hypothetical protein
LKNIGHIDLREKKGEREREMKCVCAVKKKKKAIEERRFNRYGKRASEREKKGGISS